MEVLVGTTLTIDVPSSPRHHHHRPIVDASGERCAIPSRLFFNGVENEGSGYRIEETSEYFPGESSESSSSIGTPDDSDNDASSERDRDLCEEEEEVQSELKGGPGLVSLDSLEESLPIKRGLSSHFVGKSKSFTDLSQVSTVKELQKQESPFNKRRRVLIASKRSRRRSSFYSWSNPKSMPLLPVDENEDDENDDYEAEKARKLSPAFSSSSSSLAEEKKPEDQVQNKLPGSCAANVRLRLGSFKSRSFSLADLQEHEDDEEEEEDDVDEHLT